MAEPVKEKDVNKNKGRKGELKMLNFRWLKNKRGQGMVEYILIVAVVVGIIFGAYKIMGGKVKSQFEGATETIATANIADEK